MCDMSLLFSRVQKKEGGGGAKSEKKSLYKSGRNMSHMTRPRRNPLIERSLQLRHVAIGACRNMSHMARKVRYFCNGSADAFFTGVSFLPTLGHKKSPLI